MDLCPESRTAFLLAQVWCTTPFMYGLLQYCLWSPPSVGGVGCFRHLWTPAPLPQGFYAEINLKTIKNVTFGDRGAGLWREILIKSSFKKFVGGLPVWDLQLRT